jgi:prevent-host-death family protein
MQTMAAGEFKAKCLGLIDEVKVTGKTVIITKRGKPMARLLPFEEQMPQENSESIFGFMRGMGTITGDIVSSEFTNEEWERMADERWERAERGNER